MIQNVSVTAYVADILHDPDVDGRARKTLRMAVLSEGIQEGIGRGVICLTPMAQETAPAAKKQEEVNGLVLLEQDRVQIPRSLHFGCDCGLPLVERHRYEHGILVLMSGKVHQTAIICHAVP